MEVDASKEKDGKSEDKKATDDEISKEDEKQVRGKALTIM